MIPPQFAYFAPTTLHEALTLLRHYGSEAKLLSGGQSLIPLMKLRLATPAYLIDINRIPGLDQLQEQNGVLSIGALTREADLECADLVRAQYQGLRGRLRIVPSAFVLGAVAPDVPLWLLVLGSTLDYRVILGWSPSATWYHMFCTLYFHRYLSLPRLWSWLRTRLVLSPPQVQDTYAT